MLWYRGRPGRAQCGQQQASACPDEHQFDGERGMQPEVIGEAAEQIRRNGDEHAAEQLGGAVGAIAVSGRGGQGQGEGERVEVGDAEPAQEQSGDSWGRLSG